MARTSVLAVAVALVLAGFGPSAVGAAPLDVRSDSDISRNLLLPARGVWLPNVSLTSEGTIPGGGGIGSCSFATPERCRVFSAGNPRFGRRDFVWVGDTRGYSGIPRQIQGVRWFTSAGQGNGPRIASDVFDVPGIDGFFGLNPLTDPSVNQTLFHLVCASSIGFTGRSNDACSQVASAVPEPGAALVFGLGFAVVAGRVRRPRA